MTTEESVENGARLSMEQQAEIGDILLSARTVSRQMVAQAREEADGIVKAAEERAGQRVREAEEQAAEILREAEEKAAALVREAEERSAPPMSEAEMQEYAVHAVEECFSRLRRQQLDVLDMINEQWRDFLSRLNFSEPAPDAEERETFTPPPITQQDIETRVNAIARELMEIIGNNN